jgi:hypothetical protein
MMQKYILRITITILGALVVFSAVDAMAAQNTMPANLSTHIKEQNTPIPSINSKKPAECTMNIVAIVVCTGGVCDGAKGNVNELILGTTGNDTINGNGGRDCILGGDGNDAISGNGGGDVCFGGLGSDTFNKCETTVDP